MEEETFDPTHIDQLSPNTSDSNSVDTAEPASANEFEMEYDTFPVPPSVTQPYRPLPPDLRALPPNANPFASALAPLTDADDACDHFDNMKLDDNAKYKEHDKQA